jgi:hypothetical protein
VTDANHRRARVVVGIVAVLVVGWVALHAPEALGRVGGGEGFSTGGGSHSSGGGHSGGGGGDSGAGDLIVMLIWLCIEYPAIGIPLVLLVIAFFVVRMLLGALGSARRTPVRRPPPSTRTAPRGPDLASIEKVDPGFSLPVLIDFVQLVHRRSTEAAPNGAWDPLAPFVAANARTALATIHADVAKVSDVVCASITVEQVMVTPVASRLVVKIADSRRESLKAGGERRVYLEERWTFQRAGGVTSLAPEPTRRMGCPSCGAAIATDAMGRCTSCQTPITDGRAQWTAVDVAVSVARKALPKPGYAPAPGGVEPSYQASTVVDPELGAQLRAFTGRHPDFQVPAFKANVSEIFLELQAAWSAGQWDRARPHTTDAMFDNLRFWMDAYAAANVHNKLDDVAIERIELVKVRLDAWYEAVTVRIWGSMKDYVVDANGKVIGGNATSDRKFSEYWTFLRSAGAGGAVKDSKHCPSCGAPLDRVNAAGICGYCDSRITSGEFTWVLSRIDQPEVYRG